MHIVQNYRPFIKYDPTEIEAAQNELNLSNNYLNSLWTIINIEIGKTYNFHLDQTVSPSFDGHTLGIQEIRNNGHTIYKENPKVNYIGGSLFLTIGLGTLLILAYTNRKKKNART